MIRLLRTWASHKPGVVLSADGGLAVALIRDRIAEPVGEDYAGPVANAVEPRECAMMAPPTPRGPRAC